MGAQTQINELIRVAINAHGVTRAANLCVVDAVCTAARHSRNNLTLIRLSRKERQRF